VQGVATEWCYQHWAKDRELTLQKLRAGSHLLRLWVSVIWWATLNNIQHEDILPRTARKSEKEVKKFPGCTDKWSTHRIFTRARGLPHKKKLSVWATFPWNTSGSC